MKGRDMEKQRLDASAQLALAHSQIGLGKINKTLKELGYKHKAKFTPAYDLSPTMNMPRYDSGFVCGAHYQWGDGTVPVVFPEMRPNACGMLVVGFDNWPDEKKLIEKLQAIPNLDLLNGNHFLILGEIKGGHEWNNNTFGTTEIIKNNRKFIYPNLPPIYFAILHGGSADKTKLYPEYMDTDLSDEEMKMLNILTNKEAEAYFEVYQQGEKESKNKRLVWITKLLAGSGNEYKTEIISDQTHQGLLSINEMLLNCHKSDGESIYPLCLDQNNVYLLKAKKDAILPHGGGYSFPQYEKLNKVLNVGGKRLYEMQLKSGGREIIEYPPKSYVYRTDEVLSKVKNNKDIEIVAECRVKLSIKV